MPAKIIAKKWLYVVLLAAPVALFFALRASQPREVLIDLGKLPNNSDSAALVARTFEEALVKNPDADIVRVAFVSSSYASAEERQFVQYNRQTCKPYFGNRKLTQTHGSGNKYISPEDFACGYWSEQQVRQTLKKVMKSKGASDFDIAFQLFDPAIVTLCN